jgi:hypothetical protein
MKTLRDRAGQFLVLVAAIAITLYFDIPDLIKDGLQNTTTYKSNPAFQSFINTYFDQKNIIPLVSGVIYLCLLLVGAAIREVPFVRRRIDKKYIYAGRYLSLPQNTEHLNIFDIKSGFMSMKYQLEGDRYEWKTQKPTGGWTSEVLEMKPKGHLTYIYTGNTDEIDPTTGQPFRGHGYTNITLQGDKLERGTGYWIDDRAGGVQRSHTNYVRLTRDIRWRLIKNQPWYNRLIWRVFFPRKSIVRAYAGLPANERDDEPFRRP